MDMNDVIMSLGGVSQITEPLGIDATDAQITAHLRDHVIGENLPTLAQVKAQILVMAEKRVTLSKSALWEKIKLERQRRTEQGGYKVGDKWFHSDQFSRTQQLGLVLLGAGIPSGLQWKTLDGSFVTMTPALAGQIFAAAATSDATIFSVAETHRAAMESSVDPSSYDFSGGWPLIFGE